MQGYIQEKPHSETWLSGFFTTVQVDGKWIPLFDQYMVMGAPISATLDGIQQRAKSEFCDTTVYVTENGRLCFGDIPSQSLKNQCKGLVRRFLMQMATTIRGR